MGPRDEDIYQEAAALWQALYDEAPPQQADGPTLLDIITRQAPIATYEQLSSPHLRPGTITGPVRRPNYG